MNFQEFRKEFFETICFTSHQVNTWYQGFDKNNLGRWKKKEYLVKLRNGYYSFPEYLENPDYALYIANRIYKPSYISLHSALSFYGLISESIVQITSVSPLKTATFTNQFGQYVYHTIRPELLFGYDLKPFGNKLNLLIAKPEKALLDLIYLYPFYREVKDLEQLRLDENLILEQIRPEILTEYVKNYKNKALENRVSNLIKAYRI